MSESEKITPLLTILKEFYTVDEKILEGLENEYNLLTVEDRQFLNDKISILLDFHSRYSKERENFPELTVQLYRLQVNALRIFLKEKRLTLY